MPTAPTFVTPALEHQLFWMLVNKGRRRDDVGRAYLAVQAALACHREAVNVGWMLGALMPEGRRTLDAAGEQIGAAGLAYFHWLFEVELLAEGDDDLHDYRFSRRHDGAQIVASLHTSRAPRSLQFQQIYERQRRALVKKRAQLLAGTRWSATGREQERG